ncbi:Rebeccamycin O-methyltransferase [Porphyromonas macacae]|uniref:Rebeccamycin O-methyltransferase n=1 Tax=Porphyromonas macacae TaxID=28115 RepID=A0A379EBN8_9PORP|nr:class I SAM-dependent methyltransferase [Porphyromonas macacae]SUB89850.1 Rebeccamycin O-methyltransferase [Porphyromonas macacae]
MFENVFKNMRKPTDSWVGRLLLQGMNWGHNRASLWGLSTVNFGTPVNLLDIGCGGGRNLSNLHKHYPTAKIYGIDYSCTSVCQSIRYNRHAVECGFVQVQEADAREIPFPRATFDGITAFETVYFWPEIERCFAGIVHVLKPGGKFMICNEVNTRKGYEYWVDLLDMAIYSGQELKAMMERAGLTEVKVAEHPNGKWVAVNGTK